MLSSYKMLCFKYRFSPLLEIVKNTLHDQTILLIAPNNLLVCLHTAKIKISKWSYVLSSSLEAYEVYLSILLTYTNSESVNLCGKILRNLKEINKNRIKKGKSS